MEKPGVDGVILKRLLAFKRFVRTTSFRPINEPSHLAGLLNEFGCRA